MTDPLESESFRQFLGTRYGIDLAGVAQSGEWSDLGNRLGAIALRLGLLEVEQIDQILEVQENGKTWRRFGEIAVDRGFLTAEQLDRLCQIQRLHRLLEAGEAVMIGGQLDMDSLVQSLADFLQEENAAAQPQCASRLSG